MALQLDNLMLRLQPPSPMKLDFGQGSQLALQKQELELMRQKFEETKRQNQEDNEIRRLQMGATMAREKMETEREKQKAQALAQAETLKQKREAMAKFTELNGKGDIEGARAMVPFMSQLGMSVSLEGEANGLPRYRIYMSPEEEARDQAANAGIGYPGDDTGQMLPPAGVGSTEEAFTRALDASAYSAANEGAPARAPEEPDYTGGVPKNVIDMSATEAQTLARLKPTLDSVVGAYPEQYQGSAGETARGVLSPGLALPLTERIKLYQDLRRSPDSLIQADIAAQAQAGNQQATRSAASQQQAQQRWDSGKDSVKELATMQKITDVWERRRQLPQVQRVLTNKDVADDYLSGAAVSRMMGERGSTTEQDVARALGENALSFIDRIRAGLYHQAMGGLSITQKNALLGVLKKATEADRTRTFEFLANVDELTESPDTDPDARRGMIAARNLYAPRDWRDEYDAEKKKKKASAQQESAPTRPFNMEEDSRAEYETRPSPLVSEFSGTKIPETSRIAFAHNNPGNLMFDNQPGATQGEPKSGGGHWAKFESVDAGLEALRQKILKAGEDGESVRSFITKYAPPEDNNDTEGYIKRLAAELKVSPDDALAETDPYEVLRFIVRQESSTILPDQYAKPEEEQGDTSDRARELLKANGY